MTKLDLKTVTKLASKGLSCTDIAERMQVCVSAVYSFCKRNNVILKRKPRGGQNAKDMLGQQFGSLKVVERVATRRKLAYWRCQCVCGKYVEYCGADLRAGKNKTCGCKIGIRNRRNWQGFGDIPKKQWSVIVNNANQRNIQFELEPNDIDQIWKVQNGKCKLSNLPISFNDRTASLDRVDNTKGYTKNNVQWVHKDINKMKGTFSKEEFIKLCKKVAASLE